MNIRKIFLSFVIILIIFQAYLGIIIYATEENIENEQSTQEMKIYSESAILIEETTGKILYEKNMNDRKFPASTTKILTAIIAIEKCDLDETATASFNAVNSVENGYTKANIQVGETFTIEQLLDVLMIQSANEAANIIAEHISGSVTEFAKLMNEKAKEIGCLNSNFLNANGIHDENHYSTAYDMAMIARYCMQNEVFRSLANKMECSLPWTEYWQQEQVDEYGERIFHNTNNLIVPNHRYYYPYCIGIKTGFTTPAKNCLISASNKDGFETIAVVLHAEATDEGLSARYLDTINLFEYGYNNYNLRDILKEYKVEQKSVQTSAIVSNDDLQDNNENKLNSETVGKTETDRTGTIFELVENSEKQKKSFKDIFILVIFIIVIIFVSINYYIYRKRKRIKKLNVFNYKA